MATKPGRARLLRAFDGHVISVADGGLHHLDLTQSTNPDGDWQLSGTPSPFVEVAGASYAAPGVYIAGVTADGTLYAAGAANGGQWIDWDEEEPPRPSGRVTSMALWIRTAEHFESAAVIDGSVLVHRWLLRDEASDWVEMETPVSTIDRVVAVSGGEGAGARFPELYLLDAGDLWSRAWESEVGWQPWVREDILVPSPVVDVSAWRTPSGHQHVVVTTADGRVAQRLHGHGRHLGSWELATDPRVEIAAAVGVATETGRQFLFGTDREGSVLTRRWRAGTTWERWDGLLVPPDTRADVPTNATAERVPQDAPDPKHHGSKGPRIPPNSLNQDQTGTPADQPIDDDDAAVPYPPRETRFLPGLEQLPLTADDPELIGDFRLKYRLAGGMSGSTKYVARHQYDRRWAFVKAVRTDEHPDIAAAIRQEGQIGRAIPPSQALAPVVDAGEDEGTTYVAQLYIPGRDLSHRISEAPGERLDAGEALALSHGVLVAIEGLSSAGVVHCDIKPSNIILRSPTDPCLVDFGAARSEGDLEPSMFAAFTPAYSAPEIARGGPATTASDVYSWAIVTVQMLAGRAIQPAAHHVESKPLSFYERLVGLDLNGVSKAIPGLLSDALDDDPGRRPSVERLKHALSAELARRKGSRDPNLRAPGPAAAEWFGAARPNLNSVLVRLGDLQLPVYWSALCLLGLLGSLAGLTVALALFQ